MIHWDWFWTFVLGYLIVSIVSGVIAGVVTYFTESVRLERMRAEVALLDAKRLARAGGRAAGA